MGASTPPSVQQQPQTGIQTSPDTGMLPSNIPLNPLFPGLRLSTDHTNNLPSAQQNIPQILSGRTPMNLNAQNLTSNPSVKALVDALNR